jgi:hypothetical protein
LITSHQTFRTLYLHRTTETLFWVHLFRIWLLIENRKPIFLGLGFGDDAIQDDQNSTRLFKCQWLSLLLPWLFNEMNGNSFEMRTYL